MAKFIDESNDFHGPGDPVRNSRARGLSRCMLQSFAGDSHEKNGDTRSNSFTTKFGSLSHSHTTAVGPATIEIF